MVDLTLKFQTGSQGIEGVHRLPVFHPNIGRSPGVFEVPVLPPDAGIVKARRDGVGVANLPLLVPGL